MYKQILAALDGSPRTGLVLDQAQHLARAHGAHLHLCQAINVPLGLPSEALSLSGGDLSTRLLTDGQRSLEALRAGIEPLPGANHVRLGRPWQVICQLAEENSVDLIVIGSHGFDTLDRLLGTTAARVVNNATCSVLVARPQH